MAMRSALTLLLLWRACAESGATEDEAAWLQLPLRRSRASLAQLCVPNEYGFNFDIATGIECMRQVTVPLGLALQNLRALAAFYEEFYVFETTVVDPAKPLHKALPGWGDLGQWGTAHGGGDVPNATKTPLVAGLRALAESLEARGADPPILEVFGPINELLAGLRDCHTIDTWRAVAGVAGGDDAEGAPLVNLLNKFNVQLVAEGGDWVLFKVENALATEPDGAAVPRVLDQTGRVVRSVNGMPPLDWLVSSLAMKKILGRWRACEKSLGARVNALLPAWSKSGVWTSLVGAANLASLQGTFAVRYEDGTEAAWSFRLTLDIGIFDWQGIAPLFQREASKSGRFKQLLEQAVAQAKAGWHVSVPPPSLLGRSAPPPPSAAFPAGLPQNESQWHVGKPGYFQEVYGYFEARTDPEGQNYMVWKMATFSGARQGPAEDPYRFKAFWGRLIEAAKAKGATRLLVDVAGNGGGDTDLAFQFIAALTAPLGLGKEESCVYYRAPIRRSYEMWKAMDASPVLAFLNSEDAVRERYPLISDELWSRFEVLLLIAGKDFLDVADDTLESIGFRSQDSTWVLPKPGSAQELHQLLAGLGALGQDFLEENPFNLGMVDAAAFDNPETLHQGGVAKNFTAKVPKCAPVEDFRVPHGFEQVLLLSDGTCGSSCDTATRNSYLFSRLAEQRGGGLRMRYITFGGPGGSAAEAKKVLGGTSFPGGNVDDHATTYFKKALAQTLLIMASAKLAGEEAVFQQRLAYARFLGSLVPDWASAEPQYAETAAYSKLGLEVPDEFLFLPTDLYLPGWYYGVTDDQPAGWNATELARMHADAARAFAAF